MKINPSEIDTIEEVGLLDGSPVKLIRLKGGFHIGIASIRGRPEEAIAAGSHPAIVKFNIEKQYPQFQPSMMKSEEFSEFSSVERHSHFLSDDLRKSGHDIYSIQKGNSVDFFITKHNLNVATVNSNIVDGSMVIETLAVDKKFSRALAGATTEKAVACKASKIKVGQ